MISIGLFCCCEKVFTHINTWFIGKNSMKYHLLEKEDFYSNLNIDNITSAD